MNIKLQFIVLTVLFVINGSTAAVSNGFIKVIAEMVKDATDDDVKIEENIEAELNFIERVNKHGYEADEHIVTTDDGYILTVYRIKDSNCAAAEKKEVPVLLVHGFAQNSMSWIVPGPSLSLAYVLASEGYDVWCINLRGSKYSNKHKTLSKCDSDYWEYSPDDNGVQDIPSTVDYILHQTESPKLNYIGLSDGARHFFTLCSRKPEYQEKIGVAITLAPASWMHRPKNMLLKLVARNPLGILTALKQIFANDTTIHYTSDCLPDNVLDIKCDNDLKAGSVCRYIYKIIMDDKRRTISKDQVGVLIANFPEPMTLKSFQYYAQHVKKNVFQMYDYGEEKNLKMYGKNLPPQYDVSKIQTPVVIIYAEKDILINTENIFKLNRTLPHVLELHKVDDPEWNHYDFIYNKNMSKLVTPTILKHLADYSTAH